MNSFNYLLIDFTKEFDWMDCNATLMWLKKSIITINSMFQLLDIIQMICEAICEWKLAI